MEQTYSDEQATDDQQSSTSSNALELQTQAKSYINNYILHYNAIMV